MPKGLSKGEKKGLGKTLGKNMKVAAKSKCDAPTRWDGCFERNSLGNLGRNGRNGRKGRNLRV